MYKQIILIAFILLISNVRVIPQSLNTLTGLYNIPSAEVMGDGQASFGAFYLSRNFFTKYQTFNENAIEYFGAIGFLPFLELSVHFTKNLAPNDALGDRTFNLKIKAIEEKEFIPAIAIGIHDPIHTEENPTNHYNSLYIVTTKNIIINNSFVNKIAVTNGYGSDIIKAAAYQYIGYFGGVSLTVLHFVNLMAEYDADRFNGGIRVCLFNHINILAGWGGFSYFMGGASFVWKL